MHNLLFYLAMFALFTTAAILITGVANMIRGGELNRRYSNKLMRARIIAQAVTILLLMAWLVTA
jgi:hypothetical protein